jgi:extracellular factor (EF) 3-hydroxypalmitic acid methyl ester biosynthesis protein
MNSEFKTLNRPSLVRPEVKQPVKIGQALVDYVNELLVKGGPEPYEYQKLVDYVNHLDDEMVEEFRQLLLPSLTTDTLQGWTYTKPLGYAGDYVIIDKIYQRYVNPDIRYRNWDRFYHIQHAAQAVRNRKDYFIQTCQNLVAAKPEARNVLILGGGPATDVYEFLRSTPNHSLHIDLIDWDQSAIDYAAEKNKEYGDRVSYLKMNVLRYVTHKRYDLIWSAGLFDYFKEKHFVYLLRKFNALLGPDGEMVIGNFGKGNPTQKLMEVMGAWYLNYRSEEELLDLGQEAEIPEESMHVDREPLGINLFLHIRNR